MKKVQVVLAITVFSLFACGSKGKDAPTPDPVDPGKEIGNNSYKPAPIKELKYDNNLNELYVTWDKDNSAWTGKAEYYGAEFEFYSLLSGRKVTRRMITNLDQFGELSVKKRDYNNEISTLRLNRYRSVVVTQRAALDEVRYRSIYVDKAGKEQVSEWININSQSTKMDKTYLAGAFFQANVANKLEVSFSSESSKPASAIAALVAGGSESKAKDAFAEWYYMQVAGMSFEPSNLAFDPYKKLNIILKDGVGVANAQDWPSHNEGRRINYEASVNNPNANLWKMPDMKNVMMHEMGHCIQWMPRDGKYKKTYTNSSGTHTENCDRMSYQEGWPDAVKIANKAYDLTTQVGEYKTALAFAYENPTENKRFVWQVDYNTSGAFMSWLRLYNGDFVRLLPWTVLMDDLTGAWSLEDAVKYILGKSYPNLTMKELWAEYCEDVKKFNEQNGG